MKYLSKITPCICAILFLIGQGGILTSCNDDLAADSYYTFTGEMMSDFLANREDFSQFKRIVERAGRMDLLASRGARTLFPPVNSGVKRKRIRLCRRHSGLFLRHVGKSLSYRTNVVHLQSL